MSEDMPMDLKALGDIESPEVVREALRRFRRRALRNGIWFLVAALLIGSWVVIGRSRVTLEERIQRALGVAPGAVYTVGNMTATLVRVADLGDVPDLGHRVGIHVLVVAQPRESAGSDTYTLVFQHEAGTLSVGTSTRLNARAFDHWIQIVVPADAKVPVDVYRECSGQACVPRQSTSIGRFTIDLRALGVPENIWR